jgi:hypothetical protein
LFTAVCHGDFHAASGKETRARQAGHAETDDQRTGLPLCTGFHDVCYRQHCIVSVLLQISTSKTAMTTNVTPTTAI